MLEDLQPIYGTNDYTSFIIRYFEEFYCEVIRHKTSILEGANEQISSEESTGKEPLPLGAQTNSPSPKFILDSLEQLLKTQAIDASRYGGEFASKYYQEAQYVMAALADEVFLHLEWSGKPYWESHLLESKIFNTHEAGQVFFEKIDLFLSNRDPSRSDIALLYLLTLGLGFQGKFRGREKQDEITKYRHELFIFINRSDPKLFHSGVKLISDAYLHTLEEAKVTYLNDFRPWFILFAASLLIMLFTSYGVWNATIGEIHPITKNILKNYDENS